MIKNISIDSSEEWKLYSPENRDAIINATITRDEKNERVFISWDDNVVNLIDTFITKIDIN